MNACTHACTCPFKLNSFLPLLFPVSLKSIIHAFLSFPPGSPGMILTCQCFPTTPPHAQSPTLTDGLVGLMWDLSEVSNVSWKHLLKLYILSTNLTCHHCHRRHITLSHVCLTLTVTRGPHLLSSIQGLSSTLPTTPKSIRVIFNHRISSFNKTPQAPVANCGHYQSHLSHYCIQKKKSILFAACSENAPQI